MLSFHEAVPTDNEAIRSILERTSLPTESVGTKTTTFYVGTEDSMVVAVAGFEFYGNDALLRSVAIEPRLQKTGIGSELVDFMISIAEKRGIKRVVLLTETAPKFFERKGFVSIDRSAVQNEGLKLSSEFSYLCPTSSICMILQMDQQRRTP
jgi:amino-acid N-acetyltransferase